MTEVDKDRLLFASMLHAEVPFTFAKFGDGELMCIAGRTGENTDGQTYGPDLADALAVSFTFLAERPQTFLSQWHEPWVIAEAIRKHPEMGRVRARWTHHHLLLLHDRSEALEEFYRALILSNRKKVFVGPAILSGAAELLRCEHHIEAPLRNAFQQYQAVNDSISNANGDVLLFCAGLASKVWIADEATRRPSSTLIDLGSALDPLFIGRTRSIPQPDKAEAQEFFEHALNGVTA